MKKQKKGDVYSFKARSSQSSSLSLGSLTQSRKTEGQNNDPTYNSNLNKQWNHQQNTNPSHPLINSVFYPNKIKAGIFRHQISYHNQKQKQKQLSLLANQNNQEHHIHKGILGGYFGKKVIENAEISPNLQTQPPIHPRILSLDNEIQQNLKRRLQLQSELQRLKRAQAQNKKAISLINNNAYNSQNDITKNVIEKGRQYAFRNRETDFVRELISKSDQRKSLSKNKKISKEQVAQKTGQNRQNLINQKIEILMDNNLKSIVQKGLNYRQQQQNKFYRLQQFLSLKQPHNDINFNKSSKNNKKMQTITPPNINLIQKLLNKLTFPQIPSQNVQKLYDQARAMYSVHQSHSDIIYLLMVSSFHLQKYDQVRKYFKQILLFKKFQNKSYWIAAQTQFNMKNYQRCIKLTQICMQKLDDKYLPRFLYLKAKSYQQQGNFTNSIVCYNQLIRIKPKIAEYYLQRAILYDKLGYQKECKDDYLMFGILKPQAKIFLQEKIMVEQNDARRKELLQIYKKIV